MFDFFINRPYLKPIYHIVTDDEKLYGTLLTAYQPFITYSHAGIRSDINNISFCFWDNYLLNLNGHVCRIPYDDALQAIEDYFYLTTSVCDDIIAFHGAVVAKDNKAIILGGHTGAGKSTLCAYLSRNGFEYISDDLALIDRKTLMLIPYPRPLQLREGGFKILLNHDADINEYKTVDFGDVYRIVIPNPRPLRNSYIVEGIYFINRTHNNNAVFPISKQQAYLNMIRSQYIYIKPDTSILNTIGRLADRGIYNLFYSDMEYVRDVLITRL